MEVNNKISNPYVAKCIMLGDSGVGKSSLLRRLISGMFNISYEATLAIDFATKDIILKSYDNQTVKLQIWDTAGQEKFRTIIRAYLRDVHIAFLVFDITNRDSWNNLNYWKSELENNSTCDDFPTIILVGTKSDLNHDISKDEIKQRAKEWDCVYYIISSKKTRDYNKITEMFSMSAEQFHKLIINKHKNGEELPSTLYEMKYEIKYKNLDDIEEEDRSWCCFQ